MAMTTATATAFIPAQRPASDPVTAPAVPAPRVPGPRTPDAHRGRAARPAAVQLPRTSAERRAYARQIVADAYYDLYCDVFTTSSAGGAR